MLSPTQWRRPAALSTLSLALLAVLTACADESRFPTEPPGSLRGSISGSQFPAIRPEEAHLHALAREVPGFGGYFIDRNGTLVAYVTDLHSQGLLRARLERVRAHLADPKIHGTSVLQGRFDFPSLARWRDLVSSRILGVVPGVVMSDADEMANRVTIGIDESKFPSARGETVKSLAALGIPGDAVRFVNTQAAQADVNQSLVDVMNPVMAGYRINLSADALPPWCTLGPVVLHNGNPAAFTNSHCTNSTYALDGIQIRTTDGAIIGAEAIDPGPTCGNKCRSSDAALIYLSSGVPYDYGRIARTVNVSYSWGTSGSLDVDQTNPYWNVVEVAQNSDVVVGAYLLKTGARTGTTDGFVSNTCADVTATDTYIRNCSIISSYFADHGDSGSPVYTYVYGSGGVKLIGIHWGANDIDHHSLSSYYRTAMSEVGGSFTSTRQIPLGAYVTGPTDVNSNPSCSLRYNVVVFGGSGSYTYSAWQPYTSGTVTEDWGNMMWATFPNPPEGHWVGVVVSDDGTGEQVLASIELTSGPSGMWCTN
jgi:hypothetical protein